MHEHPGAHAYVQRPISNVRCTSCGFLPTPAFRRSFPCDFSPSLWRHLCRSRFTAPAPEFGSRRFCRIGQFFEFLAGRDPHDLDGVADHVGGALLASGAARHQLLLELIVWQISLIIRQPARPRIRTCMLPEQ
jgi:hypothetical protein